MKHTLYYIAALLMALTASACRDGRAGAADGDLTIAYLPITHALPLAELPQVAGLHVKLVRYGSWPELLDALNTGRVDGASVLVELAMKARERGLGISAYALGHRDGNVIVVAGDVRGVRDLRGRAFAIPHRCSSHHILLQEALRRGGLGEADIRLVELSPAEMPSALANGQIAGYSVAEPFGAVGLKGGAHVLYRSEELWPNSVCCALVFNDRAARAKRGQVERLVKAYHAAGDRLADKAVALRAAKGMLSQPDGVLRQSLQWIDFSRLTITPEAYRGLAERVRVYGIIDNPPSYASFVK